MATQKVLFCACFALLVLISFVSAEITVLNGGSGFIFSTQTITTDGYAADIWYNNLEFPANGGEIINLGDITFEDITSYPTSGYTNIVDVSAGHVYVLKITKYFPDVSYVKLKVSDGWTEYSPVVFEWDYLYNEEDITPPTINIIMPTDGSTVNGDFTSLVVETNENAVCEFKFGKGINFEFTEIPSFVEMEITGEDFHMQPIENLEETLGSEVYGLWVSCVDGSGNSAEEQIYFNVDLTELREVMILEDIGDYEYLKSVMYEINEEGIITVYYAYYDQEDDNIYAISIMEFENRSLIEEYLEEAVEVFDLVLQNINGQDIYVSNGDLQYTTWANGEFIISVMVFSFEESEPMPLSLVEAYLEKYPSDLFLDKASPIVTLISPEDDYVKKTSQSSKKIDFKFKVSDGSDIVSCSLIIDGEVEETKTNVQKDVENVFSERLKKGSYDWQIKCVDSEGNEGSSETRDLRIKKRTSSSSSDDSELDDNFILDYQPTKTEQPIDQTQEEIEFTEPIVLKKKEDTTYLEKNNWSLLVIGSLNIILVLIILIVAIVKVRKI